MEPVYCDGFFFPLLREIGAKSIVTTVYGFDREFVTSMSRVCQGRHSRYYHKLRGNDAAKNSMELCDIAVFVPCGAHDAQNALRWGMGPHYENEEKDFEDIHILIESLRNGLIATNLHTGFMIATCVQFRNAPFPAEDVEAWYRSLNHNATAIEDLVEVDPFFDGTSRWVNPALRGDLEIYDKIQDV